MKPVVLIETDAGATRFRYRRFSDSRYPARPEETDVLDDQTVEPGQRRPFVGADVIEKLRTSPKEIR